MGGANNHVTSEGNSTKHEQNKQGTINKTRVKQIPTNDYYYYYYYYDNNNNNNNNVAGTQ
jgi:hypothetical protein